MIHKLHHKRAVTWMWRHHMCIGWLIMWWAGVATHSQCWSTSDMVRYYPIHPCMRYICKSVASYHSFWSSSFVICIVVMLLWLLPYDACHYFYCWWLSIGSMVNEPIWYASSRMINYSRYYMLSCIKSIGRWYIYCMRVLGWSNSTQSVGSIKRREQAFNAWSSWLCSWMVSPNRV